MTLHTFRHWLLEGIQGEKSWESSNTAYFPTSTHLFEVDVGLSVLES